MSRNLRPRVERLECQILTSDDQIEFEKNRRFHFNLDSVSDLALLKTKRAILGEIEKPGWLSPEFLSPIPQDASRDLVRQADSFARESMVERDETGENYDLKQLKERAIEGYCKTHHRRFDSLAEVQEFMEGSVCTLKTSQEL